MHPAGPTAEEIAGTEVPAYFIEPVLTAAAVLVFLVDLEVVAALDQDLDRIGIVGGGSVYPLVWNVLLAARNEGFGGTITTMAVAEEPAVRDLLGVPDTFALAAVVPIGRPAKAGHQAEAPPRRGLRDPRAVRRRALRAHLT